ncbi:MAG: hypothetical protein GXP01_10420, partial [Alphaproteobacteria bacterium]|nr:hypothetical protein [Alphaproteobacteria bacterium]
WARELLGLTVEAAEALAVEADSNPGEAVFLPYLEGERFPFVDLDVRAGFTGLGAGDGPGDLYYAVLEGVAFAIAANLAALSGRGPITLVGGGAQSGVWPAIIADVCGTTIKVPKQPLAATSVGAYRIACKALGRRTPEAEISASIAPRPERRARIDRLKKRFDGATALARTLG